MQWICDICGYVHDEEERPNSCPICGAPGTKFSEFDTNEEDLEDDRWEREDLSDYIDDSAEDY